MKKLLIVFAVMMFFITAYAAQEKEATEEKVTLHWLTDLAEAQQIAAENGRPILVDFTGSDWCGWCIKLDEEVFDKDAFVAYATENLVLVKLDFPRRIPQPPAVKKKNEMLARKYGVRGFPTILLLNADGSVIAQTGYQQGGAEKYVEHLKGLLEPKKDK